MSVKKEAFLTREKAERLASIAGGILVALTVKTQASFLRDYVALVYKYRKIFLIYFSFYR